MTWKKGQSGNPNGRPKRGFTFTESLERESEELVAGGMSKRDAMVKVLFKKALKGDLKAMDMIMDRIQGRPSQSVDVTSDGEQLFDGIKREIIEPPPRNSNS